VVGRGVGRRCALVPLEVSESTRLLLDDLHANAPVVFELPPEQVAVVDVEFAPNLCRNRRLSSRHCTFRGGSVTAHVSMDGCRAEKLSRQHATRLAVRATGRERTVPRVSREFVVCDVGSATLGTGLGVIVNARATAATLVELVAPGTADGRGNALDE
jgi:hypothetical protein